MPASTCLLAVLAVMSALAPSLAAPPTVALDDWEEPSVEAVAEAVAVEARREQHMIKDLLRRSFIAGRADKSLSPSLRRVLSRQLQQQQQQHRYYLPSVSSLGMEDLLLLRKRAAEAATPVKADEGGQQRQGRDWMTRLG